MKYYSFSNPHYINYRPCNPKSPIIRYPSSIENDKLRKIVGKIPNLFESVKFSSDQAKNARVTYCIIPSSTDEKFDVYMNSLIPLGVVSISINFHEFSLNYRHIIITFPNNLHLKMDRNTSYPDCRFLTQNGN